jgi:hypothetical protein
MRIQKGTYLHSATSPAVGDFFPTVKQAHPMTGEKEYKKVTDSWI